MSSTIGADQNLQRNKISADPFAWSVVLALSVTVIQKAVGFGRTVAFCKLLPDEQLGQWSMSYSFLIFAAPFVVFGLPGCFGRYAEQFRKENTLAGFLRTSGTVTLVSTLACFFGLLLFREDISSAVFGGESSFGQMLMLGIVFLTTVWFNFFIELVGSLRQIKLAAWMQFISAVAFSISSVVLILTYGPTVQSVLAGYSIGFAISMMIGVVFVVRHRRELLGKSEIAVDPAQAKRDSIWRKVMAYAVWLWIIDALTNLFSYIDLYMILHWSQTTTEAAQSAVGQYHSGHVLPLLLGAVTGILFRALLPNMSVAWEDDRKQEAGQLLCSVVKLAALGFSLFGIIVTILSPVLFEWILDGRYSLGQSIMPIAMVSISWISLAMLTQSYHWCAEKGYLTAASFAIGIVVNFGLNAALIPIYGIMGAVTATATANGILVLIVVALANRIGWKINATIWPALAYPLVVLLPGPVALAVFLATIVIIVKTDWVLTTQERDRARILIEKANSFVGRLAH